MTTGELIVVAIFGAGLLCSLSLLLWLRKLIRREGDSSRAVPEINADAPEQGQALSRTGTEAAPGTD